MTDHSGPAAITIRSWANRLISIFGLCCGGVLAAALGAQFLAGAPVFVVVAYFAAAGVASIWSFYRICRMGVRFDDEGITLRNFLRTSRLNWAEVSYFADGEVVGNDPWAWFWILKIVLRDGRSVTARGTMRVPWARKRKPASFLEVLAKLRQVAARYQILERLTGEPGHRVLQRWHLNRPDRP